MSSLDPSYPLQVGVHDLLAGDSALGALVTGVFDEPPEDTFLNYVIVGSRKQSVPDNVHGSFGRIVTMTVDTWTRARSSIPGDQIGARVVELLDHQDEALDPLVTGHAVWRVSWDQHQSVDDDEREIRHRIDTFTIHTAQEE